jgi:hypothetical protein
MHNKKLSFSLAVLAGLWLAGAAAADEPPDPPAGAGPAFWAHGAAPGGLPGGPDMLFLHGHGPGPEHGGPALEVVHTLLEIERLYRVQGRNKEVVALYQDVLGRTRDPLVRHFAYASIARAQEQPADTDKAVATLKQSLEESLQRLNQLPPPRADKPAGP